MESPGSGFLGLAYFTQHTVLKGSPTPLPVSAIAFKVEYYSIQVFVSQQSSVNQHLGRFCFGGCN